MVTHKVFNPKIIKLQREISNLEFELNRVKQESENYIQTEDIGQGTFYRYDVFLNNFVLYFIYSIEMNDIELLDQIIQRKVEIINALKDPNFIYGKYLKQIFYKL